MFNYFSRHKWSITILLAYTVFVLIHVHLYNPLLTHGSDEQENLAGAYNIAKFNTYSVNTLDDKPHPTAAREPLFPLIVGMVIKVKNIFADSKDDIRNKGIETIYHLEIESPSIMNHMTLINISFLLLTIIMSCVFVHWMTKSYLLVLYSMVTLIFSAALAEGAHGFLSEILAGLLITFISILFYYSKNAFHQRKFAVCLGVTISALVLTKALYLYFIPFAVLYLISTNYQYLKRKEQPYTKNFMIFLACIAVLVGGWMLRNYIDMGRFYIAERKALTLMYRAEYDSISPHEYPYTFAVWTPGLSKYFLTKDTEANWTRLENRQGNDSIIMDAYSKIFWESFKDKKLNLNGLYNQSDLIELEKRSLQKIMAHPMGHLKLTLAFLWRSYFIEDGAGLRFLGIKLPYEANAEKRVDNFPLAFIVNIPFWFGFFYLLAYSIRRRSLADFGLILIPGFTVFMYAFAAFSHHRYMSQLIPIMTIIFCITVKTIMDQWSNKSSLQPAKLQRK